MFYTDLCSRMRERASERASERRRRDRSSFPSADTNFAYSAVNFDIDNSARALSLSQHCRISAGISEVFSLSSCTRWYALLPPALWIALALVFTTRIKLHLQCALCVLFSLLCLLPICFPIYCFTDNYVFCRLLSSFAKFVNFYLSRSVEN